MAASGDHELIELGCLATIKSKEEWESNGTVTGQAIRRHLSTYHDGRIHDDHIYSCLDGLNDDGLITVTERGRANHYALTEYGEDVLYRWVSCLVRADRTDIDAAPEVVAGVDPTDEFGVGLFDVTRLDSIALAAAVFLDDHTEGVPVSVGVIKRPIEQHFGREIDDDTFEETLKRLERIGCLSFVRSGEYHVTDHGHDILAYLSSLFAWATAFDLDEDLRVGALSEPLTAGMNGPDRSALGAGQGGERSE